MSLSLLELFFGRIGFAQSLELGGLVDKGRLATDGDTSERGVSLIKRRLDFGTNNICSRNLTLIAQYVKKKIEPAHFITI